jgi:hypothetical protein
MYGKKKYSIKSKKDNLSPIISKPNFVCQHCKVLKNVYPPVNVIVQYASMTDNYLLCIVCAELLNIWIKN